MKFNTADRTFFDEYYSVEYVQDFPHLDNIPESKDKQNFLFATKSNEWAYEQEVRVIKKSNSLAEFNPTSLEEIYFGAKCSELNITTIMNLIKADKNYKRVSFHKMKLALDNFKLETESIPR